MIGPFANHLWQSTVFAIAVAVLAIVFRHNQARVRYALWFGASIKFFIPFTLLMNAGQLAGASSGLQALAPAAVSVLVTSASEPFDRVILTELMPPTAMPVDWLLIALISIWACGLLAVAWLRLQAWRRVRAALRASTPLLVPGHASTSFEIRSTPYLLEPGVVGLRRPVLLLPVDLVGHLTAAQLEAVLAHEHCHVRRRDNLTAATHMLVEMVFWFHPLVWWIGARLVAERERACDEHVLDVVAEPRAYAEGILRVCTRYLEAPHPCMSGVSGADLRARIEAIMFNRVGGRLTAGKRATLAMATVIAVVAPLAAGMVRAQSPDKFDVASVKPCDDASTPSPARSGMRQAGNGTISFSPGRIVIRCATVERLVQLAYGNEGRELQPKIKNGPAWVDADRFTIEAKADGTPERGVMTGPMLRALLEERFKLTMHRETQEGPIYAMTVARGGLKIRPNKEGDCLEHDPSSPLTREQAMAAAAAIRTGTATPVCGQLTTLRGPQSLLAFGGTTLANMAVYLSTQLDRPVIDRTGVEGTFNIRLEFAGESAGAGGNVRATSPDTDAADPVGPSLFAALEEQGLKLDATKGPRQVFVIDRIERPTPN